MPSALRPLIGFEAPQNRLIVAATALQAPVTQTCACKAGQPMYRDGTTQIAIWR